ncbi:hypothetical protein DFS33DRAFT_1339158 [Desarmillaria ectypa]|nr:hypothetical protein DFS33DRAFT_1339158 [Desarmillaria ectypa]
MTMAYHMSATSPVILMTGSLFIQTARIAWGGMMMAKIQMKKRRGRAYHALGSTLERRRHISLENVVIRRKCTIYLFFMSEPREITRPDSLGMTRSPV